MFLKSSIAGLIALAGVTFASAVPLPEWTTNPAYFDLNSLSGTVAKSNQTPKDFDYKFEADGAKEEGDLASLFSTTLSSDKLSALISWTPAGSVILTDIYLKSSTKYIHWVIPGGVDWSLYSGFYVTNTQILNHKGKAQGISHLTLNGRYVPPPPPPTPTPVPVPEESGTLILLASGLAALLAWRNRRV
jgi:hypothetical protein